jgi:hypothetical protein
METVMANTHDFGNAWHLVDCQFPDTAFDLGLIDIDMGAANGERAGNGAFQVCHYQLIIEGPQQPESYLTLTSPRAPTQPKTRTYHH